jgi:hypothetical protein
MEAARLSDEGARFFEPKEAEGAGGPTDDGPPAVGETPLARAVAPEHIRIKEILLCSGGGEVLYQWECNSLETRLKLLDEVEQQGKQLGARVRAGMFDRVEIYTSEERIVCQVQPHRRLLVRSAGHRAELG